MKKLLLISLFFITGFAYSADTTIQLASYAHGEITIENTLDPNTQWYEDIITFRPHFKISFIELDQMLTGRYLGIGGIVNISDKSEIHYRNCPTLEKEYTNWALGELQQGMHTDTKGSDDIDWNKAMKFPDSLAACDTFVHDYGNPTCYQAKCLYSVYMAFYGLEE